MKNVNRIKNAVFFTVLGVLAAVGLLWFARPEASEIEKRRLTTFPQFTAAGLLDGSFAGGVDKWYADTYPLREAFITGANRLKALYGDRSVQIVNGGANRGDEIPTVSTGPGGETDGPGGESGGESAGSSLPQESEPPVKTGPVETEPPDAPTESGGRDEGPAQEGEINGPIFLAGDTAYGMYYFNRDAAERYATQVVNRACELLRDEAQVYSLIVPTSSGVILNKATQESIGVNDQDSAIEYANSLMDPSVRALNVFGTLNAHDGEYIYFRTDHHWTALGAYYAYTDFCGAKGAAPHALEDFEKREYPGFLGSFYSSTMAKALENNPDTVDAYVPMGTNSMVYADKTGKETAWFIISDVSGAFSGGKYYCFSGSDQPYSYAHNPQITDGSACCVVKDSFGNAFIPFLIDHYEYVYWIDFRYYGGTLPALVRDKGVDDVLFCLNIENISSDRATTLMLRLLEEE